MALMHKMKIFSFVIFDPIDLMGKLAALVPPPRFNLVGYYVAHPQPDGDPALCRLYRPMRPVLWVVRAHSDHTAGSSRLKKARCENSPLLCPNL
jgi:hypothetical protein